MVLLNGTEHPNIRIACIGKYMFSYCFVYHVNNPLLYAIQEIIKTVVNGNLFLKVIEKLKYIELLRKSQTFYQAFRFHDPSPLPIP